jgi:SOS response regulatory protein OraA/RecX
MMKIMHRAKMHRALKAKGYTADEIEVLLKSVTELFDKLKKKAESN